MALYRNQTKISWICRSNMLKIRPSINSLSRRKTLRWSESKSKWCVTNCMCKIQRIRNFLMMQLSCPMSEKSNWNRLSIATTKLTYMLTDRMRWSTTMLHLLTSTPMVAVASCSRLSMPNSSSCPLLPTSIVLSSMSNSGMGRRSRLPPGRKTTWMRCDSFSKMLLSLGLIQIGSACRVLVVAHGLLQAPLTF